VRNTLAEIAARLASAQTEETVDERYSAIAAEKDYKKRAKMIEALSGAELRKSGPSPYIERCARTFPESIAVRVRGEWQIRDRRSGAIRGSGESITRACKAALRGAK